MATQNEIGGVETWTSVHADAVVTLGDQILELANEIEEAVCRLLRLIVSFDDLRGWEQGGFPSCAHWLAARAGMDLGAAREKVRTARALVELPNTQAALACGRITYSQARALTRVATPDDEATLLELSEGYSTAQVERMVRGWRMRTAEDEAAREEARYRARCFSVLPDIDGMYRVNGRLTPEQGAILMRAIDWMGDLLFREGTPGDAYETPEVLAPSGAVAARRRADALALLAERAMGGPGSMGRPRSMGGPGSMGRPRSMGAPMPESRSETAPVAVPEPTGTEIAKESEERIKDRAKADEARNAGGEAGSIPISGSLAERFQVMVYVDLEALERRTFSGAPDDGAVTGRRLLRSMLEDNVRVSQETLRRRSCDAAVVPVGTDSSGRILNLGQRVRTVSPAIRRALEARDGGCRFVGCGRRYTDAHHIEHWADGGETSLRNCILLCRFHHRLLHEGGWSVHGDVDGQLVFVDPRGGTHGDGRWAIRHQPRSHAYRKQSDGGNPQQTQVAEHAPEYGYTTRYGHDTRPGIRTRPLERSTYASPQSRDLRERLIGQRPMTTSRPRTDHDCGPMSNDPERKSHGHHTVAPPQWRNSLREVNTIAMPCSLAAAITSSSLTDPPG